MIRSLVRKIKNKISFWVVKYLNKPNLIAKTVKIGSETKIQASHISGLVSIGRFCKIKEANIYGNISIGHNTSIWGPNVTIKSDINSIVIGNYCSIARNVSIQESNHNFKNFTTYYINNNVLKNDEVDTISNGNIIIGHDVWIGDGAKILSGVTIGTGAVIGANCVVTKDVPEYAIVGGVPGQILSYRFEPEVIFRLKESKWWDVNHEELKGLVFDLENIVANKLDH